MLPAQTHARPTTVPPPSVTEVLLRNFGAAVEPMTAFQPFYVTGDFNGDGAQDIAAVIRIKATRPSLPKDVRLQNPFEVNGAIQFPRDPAVENKLALAIVHSWTTANPIGKFLLIGDSPVLILEYDRAGSAPEYRKGLIELMSKHGKQRKGMIMPRASKGDVITMGTEVGGDSLLYWNGRRYVWEDAAED
ncbi:MAG TPA: hypothetical protein VK208_16710 [Pyrinomonadaceae bacterium]|jgi:hypothetical protein|nr:hypothetical protein [Pyrinomonadaceae bacterium]